MERSGRQPKIHQANTIHHVMMRGNNRQNIFFGNDYFIYFFKVVSESVEKFDHKILAYCLMTNHIHLIVHINESSLSAVMQNINFRYARWANHRRKTIGHLFQARYRSIEVTNDNYLINLCRYIHLNPVVANMVKNPAEYGWSSHKNYISGDAYQWLDLNIITRAIEHKTELGYLDFMSHKIDREKWKPALYLSTDGKIVIDDDLIKNANETTLQVKSKRAFLSRNSVTSIICENLDVDEIELYSLCKNHQNSKKRALLATYWLKYSGMKLSEIANVLQRSEATMHRQLSQLNRSSDNYFSKALLQKIEVEIKKRLVLPT